MNRKHYFIRYMLVFTIMCSILLETNIYDKNIKSNDIYDDGFHSPSFSSDDYEENDDKITATQAFINQVYMITTDDPDWFQISLNVNDNLSIFIDSNDTSALQVHLYSNDGVTSVGIITIGTKQIHAYIMPVTLAGIYYLVIECVSATTENFVTFKEGSLMFEDDSNENDDNPSTDTITHIEEGTTGQLMSLDEDWFSFDVLQNWIVDIEVVYYNYGEINFGIYNYSEYTSLVATPNEFITEYPSGEHYGKRLVWNATVGGLQYIKINPIAITSYQILFRVYGDSIDQPSLDLTSLDNFLGITTLSWNTAWEVLSYYIFRSTTGEITDISSMTPYAISKTCPWEEFIQPNGNYYYAVMATDFVVNSSLSNCVWQNINVQPLTTPVITLTSTNPTTDGFIEITWTPQPSMHTVYIYRSNDSFDSIENMQYIDIRDYSVSSYMDYVNKNGSYYYRVIFGNPIENSSLSNTIQVKTDFKKPGKPTLSPINVNYGKGRYIQLEFSAGSDTTQMFIYRANSSIISVENLYPIQIVESTTKIYLDEIPSNGTLYYTIAGYNSFGLIGEPADVQSIFVNTTLNTNYVVQSYDLGLIDLSDLTTSTLGTSYTNSIYLPFNFSYYGVLMDRLYFSMNGMVRFLGGPTFITEASIPSNESTLRTSILPFFHSISESPTFNTKVYNSTEKLIIQWEETDTAIGEYYLFQLALYSNGTFEFRYSDLMSFTEIPVIGINYGDAKLYNNTLNMATAPTGLNDLRFTPYLIPSIKSINTDNNTNSNNGADANNDSNSNNSTNNSTNNSSENSQSAIFEIHGYFIENIGIMSLVTIVIISYHRKHLKKI